MKELQTIANLTNALKVIPGIGESLSDNNTIRIAKSNEVESAEVVSEELSMENVLSNYDSVSEKIVKEQVTVNYETETKDLSTGDGEKQEVVVQNGVDGVKEISYKVKYLNGEEVEKTQISENIVQEPVNCVKEIRTKKVVVATSRSSTTVATTSAPTTSNIFFVNL